MNGLMIKAFADELEKIGGIAGALASLGSKDLPSKLKLLKYPALVGGGIVGWERLKKMKNRYDIGKAYEAQMNSRG